jgi:GTPase
MPEPYSQDLARELDEALFGVADMQAELNYEQAKSALGDLLSHLDLTPTEREGLETEIGGLETMLEKLESATVQIAVFGMVGRGKSSLLNAIVGQPIFKTGPLHGVTQDSQRVQWRLSRESADGGGGDIWQASFPGAGNSRIELLDTPGLDEVDGQCRTQLAHQVAKQADLVLFVVAGDITQVEYDGLLQVRDAGKPLLLVFNKIDRYPDADRQAIYEQIRDRRVRQILKGDRIVMAAASPLVAKATRRPDGSMGVELVPGPPQVEELKLKILEILHREGKSLVALNSLLYADDVNQKTIARKMEIRDRSADGVIWQATIAKAIAIAVNPIAAADMLGAAIVDAILIITLSKLYGLPVTRTGALELLQKIALGMGGIGASEWLANLGLSSLKGLLGLATPVTGGLALGGYISVALTQASLAGVATYSIGQVAKTYLANGASWGDESPKAAIARILSSIDETSILDRIKDELQAKISLERKRENRSDVKSDR